MSVAPYTYEGISEELKKIAKKELNENPEQVNAHIESLRRWVRSMPHITCPMESEFLIRFLRVAKFEHSKAQARLDNYCTIRSSPRGCPAMFKPLSPDDPFVDKVLDAGQFLFLGLSDRSELVFINRIGAFNPEEGVPPEDYMNVNYAMIDCFTQLYPNLSIVGSSLIMDLSGMTQKQMKFFSDQKMMKNSMKIWQDALPVRSKDIIYYNEPIVFDVLFKMVEFWLKPKLRQRLHRVKDNLKKAHQIIPGGKRLLPAEYGGENKTVEELKKEMKQLVKNYLAKENPLHQIKIDESQRPESTMKYLKQYSDCPMDLGGTKGTYVKLDV
jgi:retinaldehyde-binding protein 1